MTARELHGLVDAATCPARPNDGARDARLRNKVVKGGIHVARKFLSEKLEVFLTRELINGFAAAFAEPAEIESQDMEAGCGKGLRQVTPDLCARGCTGEAEVCQDPAGLRRSTWL